MNFQKAKKVFVVDDDPMVTEALKDYLTQNVPHQVHSFKTGEECLASMGQKPDVIVLDYHLNSVSKNAANGMEILEQVKKHYPGIHVIMLSSLERYGTAMQTIQKGAEQYVIKDEKAFEKIASLISEMN